MTKVYPLFYNPILPTFTEPNKLFQGEDLCIFLLYDYLHQFWRNLIGRFVNIHEIKFALTLKNVNLEIQSMTASYLLELL